MPLFRMKENALEPVEPTTFAARGIRERGDLQRLLRAQIDVIDENLLVIAEEFGEWDESDRRIDLLALDRDASLVVIELKRTSDGGHMELQALRYAAMVSTMTFDQAAEAYARFLASLSQGAEDARTRILDFLGWEEPGQAPFAQEVRILLVSEDFGKELTTAVLWLREYGLDIRCVRLRPYSDSSGLLLDVQQVIPLPEAQQYQVRVGARQQAERQERTERQERYERFWKAFAALARQRGSAFGTRGSSPLNYLRGSSPLPGLRYVVVVYADEARGELYFSRADAASNKAIYDALHARRESVEAAFGGPLFWERLDHRKACRIYFPVTGAGIASPEEEWPKLQATLVEGIERLERALKPALAAAPV